MTPRSRSAIEAKNGLPVEVDPMAPFAPGRPSADLPGPKRVGQALCIPAERLYWAVFEAPQGRAGASGETLRYLFEPHLPVALEDVECRFVRVGSGQILACGVERERLRSWLDADEHNSAVDAARPLGVPAAALALLHDIDIGAQPDLQRDIERRIDFRSGAFETPRRAQRRRVNAAALVSAACLALTLLAAGKWRSAEDLKERAQQATIAAQALAQSVLDAAPPSGLDPRLALSATLRRAEQTRDDSAGEVVAEDRSADVAALLAAWPADVPTSVDSAELTQTTLTIRGSVRDSGDYERLREALTRFSPRWAAKAGDLSRAKEGAGFTLVFERVDESAARALAQGVTP